MPISLTPHFDGDPIKLDKAILLIGRHPQCDIVLLSSRKVSRMHCCIAQASERLLIRDLGSTNGITVNGERIEEAEIRVGDEVTIGDLEFCIGNGSSETVRREPAPLSADSPQNGHQPQKVSVLDSKPDSSETPMIDDIPLAEPSSYSIVVDDSQQNVRIESNSDESSYVELNESDM